MAIVVYLLCVFISISLELAAICYNNK